MTLEEKCIVSAYTGYLMCDFGEVHKYIEKILGRPVWTHELASPDVQAEIKNKTRIAFLNLCKTEEDKKPIGFAPSENEDLPCGVCTEEV